MSADPGKFDEKELAAGFTAALRQFPEDTFNRVQQKTLSVIKRYDANHVAMPLFHKDTGADLFGLSLVEIAVLISAALAFNLHCFFEPGAKSLLLTVFPDLSSLAAPGSTPTS
jgi:hypothetical protein